MNGTAILLVVLVLLVLAAAALFVVQTRKRKALQERFGPEYDRTVEDSDGKRRAERELRERAEHRDTLDIKPLEPAAREDYAEQWRATQERFVDAPDAAVTEADRLVARVMQQRGYPVGDFDQMARDVSVDHSQVVQEYRAAREISERNDREQATTEELRQAMMHYRALFSDLLGDSPDRSENSPDRSADGPTDERRETGGRR